MSKRTDIHCPSNFVLEDYDFQWSFSVAFDYDGDPIDEQGLGELMTIAHESDSMVDTHGANVKRLKSVYSGTSTLFLRCDVCGASFKHGSLLSHKSGKLLVVGHECSDSIEGATAGAKKVKGLVLQAAKKSKRSKAKASALAAAKLIIDATPDLAEALKIDHYIIRDIKFRLEKWGNISEKQIALVFKISNEMKKREEEKEEFISVPLSGRQTITGTVVFSRWETNQFSYYGADTMKGLIVVESPEGNWKTWGTIPTSIVDELINHEDGACAAIKGKSVTLTANIKIGDDPKMSFYSRPSKGSLVMEVE